METGKSDRPQASISSASGAKSSTLHREWRAGSGIGIWQPPEKTENNDPDFTEGIRLSVDPSGIYYVEDHRAMRESPFGVEEAIKNTASADGAGVEIGIPQDPAQAGKSQAQYLIRKLSGFTARARMSAATRSPGSVLSRHKLKPGTSKSFAGHGIRPFLITWRRFQRRRTMTRRMPVRAPSACFRAARPPYRLSGFRETTWQTFAPNPMPLVRWRSIGT